MFKNLFNRNKRDLEYQVNALIVRFDSLEENYVKKKRQVDELLDFIKNELGLVVLGKDGWDCYEVKAEQAKENGYKIIGSLPSTRSEIWKKTRK